MWYVVLDPLMMSCVCTRNQIWKSRRTFAGDPTLCKPQIWITYDLWNHRHGNIAQFGTCKFTEKIDVGDCTRISNLFDIFWRLPSSEIAGFFVMELVTAGRPQCQDFSFDQSFQTKKSADFLSDHFAWQATYWQPKKKHQYEIRRPRWTFPFFCRWKLLFIWPGVELENDGPRLPRRFLWFWTRWCFQTSWNMFVKLDQGKQNIESLKLRCADRNRKSRFLQIPPCYERILNTPSSISRSLPFATAEVTLKNSQSFRPPKRKSNSSLPSEPPAPEVHLRSSGPQMGDEFSLHESYKLCLAPLPRCQQINV